MIQIQEKKDCCGCSACVQRCPKHCITMHEDAEGFLYPEVDVSACIGCGLCEKVCPVINQYSERKPWAVYAAKNPDDEVRMQSSSGGVFTMLAEKCIDEGGVVFGACWDEEWNVKHTCIEKKEDIVLFRSSKYLQSIIGDSYCEAERLLKSGRKVLFTGTPCQIAGLKHFLRKDYDNLLTVDIVCHSVPSPGVWQQYLQEKLRNIGLCKSNIQQISFRNKSTGWKSYSFVIKDNSGNTHIELSSQNAFMRGFLADLYTRPSCHVCPTKCLKSSSDITLGDFWGITSLMPQIDDNRGVSVTVVSTEKGMEFLHDINIQLYPLLYGDVSRYNPALIRSVSESKNRVRFFKNDERTFEEKIRELVKEPFSWRVFSSRLIHNVLPSNIVETIKTLRVNE